MTQRHDRPDRLDRQLAVDRLELGETWVLVGSLLTIVMTLIVTFVGR